MGVQDTTEPAIECEVKAPKALKMPSVECEVEEMTAPKATSVESQSPPNTVTDENGESDAALMAEYHQSMLKMKHQCGQLKTELSSVKGELTEVGADRDRLAAELDESIRISQRLEAAETASGEDKDGGYGQR